jgi:hypothetical protein
MEQPAIFLEREPAGVSSVDPRVVLGTFGTQPGKAKYGEVPRCCPIFLPGKDFLQNCSLNNRRFLA